MKKRDIILTFLFFYLLAVIAMFYYIGYKFYIFFFEIYNYML